MLHVSDDDILFKVKEKMEISILHLCTSSVARRLGIDNTPSQGVKNHLLEVITLLECIEKEWDSYCESHNLKDGIIITSGYRCVKLNRAVGRVSTSAHVIGYAADIVPENRKQDIFERFMSTIFAKKGYKFDQIIVEKSKYARWVHVGVKNIKGQQRQQCFVLNVK